MVLTKRKAGSGDEIEWVCNQCSRTPAVYRGQGLTTNSYNILATLGLREQLLNMSMKWPGILKFSPEFTSNLTPLRPVLNVS